MISNVRMITGVFAVLLSLIVPQAVSAGEGSGKGEMQSGMTITQAVVLGAIEGITEYLPVSSTGHLLVAERLMGLGHDGPATSEKDERDKEAADAYAICIQAGAILAVLGLYSRRVKQMIMGMLGKDEAGLRMVVNIAAAFLPAAVIGLLFNKLIKAYLFGIWPVILAWVAGGIAILAVSRWREGVGGHVMRRGMSLGELRGRMALMIGVMQCIAMWPGVSRSLVTIVGGLLVGLSISAAVEFSFLLGLVTLTAATGYDALRHGQVMLQAYDALPLAVGLLSAFFFAMISVKWMVAYLNRHSLAIFGYYRLLVAPVVAALSLFRVI